MLWYSKTSLIRKLGDAIVYLLYPLHQNTLKKYHLVAHGIQTPPPNE